MELEFIKSITRAFLMNCIVCPHLRPLQRLLLRRLILPRARLCMKCRLEQTMIGGAWYLSERVIYL
jgi:hypothetical protein